MLPLCELERVVLEVRGEVCVELPKTVVPFGLATEREATRARRLAPFELLETGGARVRSGGSEAFHSASVLSHCAPFTSSLPFQKESRAHHKVSFVTFDDAALRCANDPNESQLCRSIGPRFE